MCAIDALGVASMLHQDITVASDPVDGHPITVTFTGGSARWEPRSRRLRGTAGPGGASGHRVLRRAELLRRLHHGRSRGSAAS